MGLKGNCIRIIAIASLAFSIISGPAFAGINTAAGIGEGIELCSGDLTGSPTAKAGAAAVQPAKEIKWTLASFFAKDPDQNLGILHPFTIANAAEKAYAMIMHKPPREALDPLYRVKKVKVYPMLAGEDPATEGRMVVGQEETIASFVAFVHSVARGDRSGKTLGFPGPAGTGKTELLYVLDNLEKNLGKQDKYKQYSYRWIGLDKIPELKLMFRYNEGKPLNPYIDPDMPRSPFTLLRSDMQKEVLANAIPAIRRKWNITVSEGWAQPEPKSFEIMRIIFENEFKDIADGRRTIDDLTPEEYLGTLSKYLVIVPKVTLRPIRSEPAIIRAQTENPNYQTLLVAPNIARASHYGYDSALGLDYTGKIMQQDGGLLMFDELFRNGGEFLNILLELIQNHIAETDFGRPVVLDMVPIWNSNDESIAKAGEDNAIKALINRTDAPAMRSLLPVNQIESLIPFQVGQGRFKMRKLSETALLPFKHDVVYPAPDAHGVTYSSHGRYALYYEMDGEDILIDPYAMSYMAWLASATRFVVSQEKISKAAGDLNIVRANSSLLYNPIERVRVNIGDKEPEVADLMELTRLKDLMREGEGGISSRDIETWMKESLVIAHNRGKGALTPLMVDQAFQKLMDEGRIKPGKDEVRAEWQRDRIMVKTELLLPKLQLEIKTIISGDGQKAERIYDEVEREFIALANSRDARQVTPEDGSQQIYINFERLTEIRNIYRTKYGRDFEPNFLLRQLNGARSGTAVNRNPELLESVRIFLANAEAKVADFGAYDAFYRGSNTDPSIRQRVTEIESQLPAFGYNLGSFQEALSFMVQLERASNAAKSNPQR